MDHFLCGYPIDCFNLAHVSFFQPVLTVMLSEALVDWLKHAFITKFNHIRPSVYERYKDVLCRDLASGSRLSARKHSYVDQSPVVAPRGPYYPHWHTSCDASSLVCQSIFSAGNPGTCHESHMGSRLFLDLPVVDSRRLARVIYDSSGLGTCLPLGEVGYHWIYILGLVRILAFILFRVFTNSELHLASF